MPAPSDLSISPPSGGSATQTAVVIQGQNFLAKPVGSGLDTQQHAWLDSTELQNVTWINVNEIHAVVPAGLSPGPKRLTVENAYGAQGSRDNAYVVDPAGLTAQIAAGATTADVGQDVQVTFTVGNGGSSGANLSTITPSATVALPGGGSATGTCTAATPTLPQSVGAHATREFTWTCSSSQAGTLSLIGTAIGTDTTTHLPLSATPAAPVTVEVQTPPQLAATLTTDVGPFSVGQRVSVTMTIQNAGGAAANLTQIPTPTGRVGTDPLAASCSTPSPSS
ncbi:MAG TPA: IPT/TIG domain-containing protein, partial [Anaeromyxobacter sp.]|nr:IPT/TIG domain-containing protein [Anaeromyxobacter sp.]